jgi:hypothetical protein
VREKDVGNKITPGTHAGFREYVPQVPCTVEPKSPFCPAKGLTGKWSQSTAESIQHCLF